jgi:hypothetical protein
MKPHPAGISLAKRACQYAERGLYVLPCWERQKRPRTKHGFHDASNDPDQVGRWWSRWPTANIGLACAQSKLVVLDVDDRHDGFATLDELESSLCELPLVPTSQTKDGLHHFFLDPGVKLKARPGIDVLYQGYVMAPPSVHPSGWVYKWVFDLDEQPLNALPDSWLALLSPAPNNAFNNADPILPPTCVRDSETDDKWLQASEELCGWRELDIDDFDWFRRSLLNKHIYYLHHQPERGWKQGRQTRSQVEQSIVLRLCWDGASDRQIRTLADVYFARHIEERPKRGYDYIDRSIASARRYLYEVKGVISSPLGGHPKERNVRYRQTTSEELDAVVELVRGQSHADWIREVQSCGFSRATANRHSKKLRDSGLIVIQEGRVVRIAQEMSPDVVAP